MLYLTTRAAIEYSNNRIFEYKNSIRIPLAVFEYHRLFEYSNIHYWIINTVQFVGDDNQTKLPHNSLPDIIWECWRQHCSNRTPISQFRLQLGLAVITRGLFYEYSNNSVTEYLNPISANESQPYWPLKMSVKIGSLDSRDTPGHSFHICVFRATRRTAVGFGRRCADDETFSATSLAIHSLSTESRQVKLRRMRSPSDCTRRVLLLSAKRWSLFATGDINKVSP